MAPLTLEYLNVAPLAGRGGVVRFFMLIHGLDFDEKLIAMSDWGATKAEMIASKENPCGSVPILVVNDDDSVPILTQHIALCRYLFRTKIAPNGDSATAMEEMLQDMVADEYQAWQNGWCTTLGSAEVKAAYKAEKLSIHLALMNALYEKYATVSSEHPFLSTTSRSHKPLWADVAVACLVYDHFQTGLLTEDELKAYPKIDALYGAFCALAPVAAWIDKVQNKDTSIHI
jgi:glutathione S-transferase